MLTNVSDFVYPPTLRPCAESRAAVIASIKIKQVTRMPEVVYVAKWLVI